MWLSLEPCRRLEEMSGKACDGGVTGCVVLPIFLNSKRLIVLA
jgi:hypothetical protein